MSGENWTPGPWFHEKGLIYNSNGDEVGVTPDWCNADRDLALAAPDLYEALENVAMALERYDSGHPLIADANLALAKARGEAQV